MSRYDRPVALILAAGFSQRFGRDKRRVALRGGRTILAETLHRIEAAGLDARLVVRDDDAPFPVTASAIVVERAVAERGLGASLAAAARQLPDGQGCLICLGDMPFIEPATYAAVADALLPHGIVVPEQADRRGHPVAFAAEYLGELRVLDGDRGARVLLERHADRVIDLPVDDAGIHRDIDTVMDLLKP